MTVVNATLKSGTVDTTPDTPRTRRKYADEADDPLMAIKEILDNMVVAGSKNITIDSILDGSKRLSMTFTDDGHGLELASLQEALKPYGTKDGTGGNENGIGGFGSLSLLGNFSYLKTMHQSDGFAYQVLDIDTNIVTWEEVTTTQTQSFFEVSVTDSLKYHTLTEKNMWKKIADIFSEQIRDGLVIQPRYFDTKGNQINKSHFPNVRAPQMMFLYPKGSTSTLKKYSDTGLGVEITIETKVLDSKHHVKTHAVSCTDGGMRVYVNQDGIRTVWGRNQSELAKLWRKNPRHASLNALCIYINFIKGRCRAKPVKNKLISTDNPVFDWLQEKIKEHLDNDLGLQPFIHKKNPEEQIQSNLVNSLLPIMNHTDILEYQPDGNGLETDIISKDGNIDCVWEVKAVKFDSKAVRQLYWYLMKGGYQRGYAVGVGFTPEAISMITDLVTNDGLDIEMISLLDPRYQIYNI